MNDAIKRISALLQSQDNVRRCAAAITLAELAPKDAAVVKMLGEALKNANPMLASYILETLEVLGSPTAVPYVMPLLDSLDTSIKMRAVAIIARAGDGVVPDLKERLPKVPRAQRIILADLLARIHTKDAFQVMLDLLFDPDFELVKEACEAVRRHIGNATTRERGMLHSQVVKLMHSVRVKDQERPFTSCLLLLGYVGSPDARAILLKHAAPKGSPYLRQHALIGLKHLRFQAGTANAMLRNISPFLTDPDDAVVRHTLDILSHLPPSTAMTTFWRKELAGKNVVVASFAVRQLAASDNPANNRELLDLLCNDSPDIREIASNALANHKSATSLLLDTLARETDAEVAWRLARILKSHEFELDKAKLKRFATIAARELRSGKPLREPLLYFLRNSVPKTADKVIREAADEHKHAKRWDKAAECLRRLSSTEAFDDETRYSLAACNLKISAKDIASNMRLEDQALRGFQVLLHGKVFPLMERLKADKMLDHADLHYVGFHFSQAQGDDKAFGDQLLQYAASKAPKPKATKKRKK